MTILWVVLGRAILVAAFAPGEAGGHRHVPAA
jgi:hypothetical protein